MKLIYAFPSALLDPEVRAYPGVERYLHTQKLYGHWVMPIDRTGTITIPVKTTSLFPVPAFRPFKKSYEELCNTRACEVLAHAERLGAWINVMYSGGIDSTCLVVSLLKNATPEQKKHIRILLSHESIEENPRFFHEHIKRELAVGSSISFPTVVGGNDILLTAEPNDLLMGNAAVATLMGKYGFEILHKTYSYEILVDFLKESLGDESAAIFYYHLFNRLCKSAPIEIRSHFELFWWINFTMKWQPTYCFPFFYIVPANRENVTRKYIDERYLMFYNTEEFQLWSMNNPDKRLKDTWKSYKWVVKDIIYEYTKDADYRDNKAKVRSLFTVMKQHPMHFKFLDEHARFRNDLKPEEYLQAENDFI